MQKIKADKEQQNLKRKETVSALDTTATDGSKSTILLGSDTDHVENRCGYTLEESNTELLKSMSKEHISTTGADITVANGIGKQRVLGVKVTGNEVDGIKTKCIIKNNGIAYNFYKSLEDKNNNVVAELGINDTFELTSDCIYKFVIDGTPYTTDKSVNDPIATTDKINIFSAGEAVKPSSFKVNVPVDKFAELETRLSTVQSSLEALSVLATEALIK